MNKVVTFFMGSKKVTNWGVLRVLNHEIKAKNGFKKLVTFPGKRGPLVFINFLVENFMKRDSNQVTR